MMSKNLMSAWSERTPRTFSATVRSSLSFLGVTQNPDFRQVAILCFLEQKVLNQFAVFRAERADLSRKGDAEFLVLL